MLRRLFRKPILAPPPNPYRIGFDNAADAAEGADIESLERWVEMAEERYERMRRETPDFQTGIHAAMGQLNGYRLALGRARDEKKRKGGGS